MLTALIVFPVILLILGMETVSRLSHRKLNPSRSARVPSKSPGVSAKIKW